MEFTRLKFVTLRPASKPTIRVFARDILAHGICASWREKQPGHPRTSAEISRLLEYVERINPWDDNVLLSLSRNGCANSGSVPWDKRNCLVRRSRKIRRLESAKPLSRFESASKWTANHLFTQSKKQRGYCEISIFVWIINVVNHYITIICLSHKIYRR